jgi:hypothetical protein
MGCPNSEARRIRSCGNRNADDIKKKQRADAAANGFALKACIKTSSS